MDDIDCKQPARSQENGYGEREGEGEMHDCYQNRIIVLS